MQKVEFAKVLKPQGIKGEIKVETFVSDKQFLLNLKQFFINDNVYTIKNIRLNDKYAYILTLEITDRNMAETLRNCVLCADKDLLTAQEDEYFISDLEDCCVVDEDDNILGYVESIEKYATTNIVNILLGGAVHSFPFLKSVLKQVDIKNKKIVVFKDKLNEVLV